MPGTRPEYRVKRSHDGGWYWTLLAANHEPVGNGETYGSQGGALEGVEANRRAAAEAIVVVDADPLEPEPEAPAADST